MRVCGLLEPQTSFDTSYEHIPLLPDTCTVKNCMRHVYNFVYCILRVHVYCLLFIRDLYKCVANCITPQYANSALGLKAG